MDASREKATAWREHCLLLWYPSTPLGAGARGRLFVSLENRGAAGSHAYGAVQITCLFRDMFLVRENGVAGPVCALTDRIVPFPKTYFPLFENGTLKMKS